MASAAHAQVPSDATSSPAEPRTVPAPQELDNSVPKAARSNVSSFETVLQQLKEELAGAQALREQVAADVNIPQGENAAATAQQRRELMDLLTKLAAKAISQKQASEALPQPSPPETSLAKPTKPAPVIEKNATHPLITDKIVDAFALGRALFRAGDYVGAEQAFRKVKVTEDNRILLQYLVATCLRKQSRWEQAIKAYRIVADNKEDPALRDLAQWQLENIRWSQQTETQLEELRQLREKSKPTSQAAGDKTPSQ